MQKKLNNNSIYKKSNNLKQWAQTYFKNNTFTSLESSLRFIQIPLALKKFHNIESQFNYSISDVDFVP